MSTGSDLTSAFGRPARDLSARLGHNPRRSRRDEAEEAPEQQSGDQPRPQAPATPDAEGARERHLAAAPEGADVAGLATTPSGSAPEPKPGPSAPASGGAGDGGATPARERPATSRARRSASAGRSGSQTRSASSAELDPSTSYQVPVYVHPGVRVAATTKRKTEKLTNAEIALNAIDEVQHRLAGLVRDRRLQARPDNSLFPGRVRRGRLGGGGAVSTDGDARRVLWGFRATGAELEIIDRLASASGAESRSELVAVALEETLLR